MREELIERLWEQAEPTVYITKEQFVTGLDGWTIEPVEIDGVLAVIAIQKGPEFHFHSLGTGKSITRKIACDYVQKIIDQHGYAETKTPKMDERQHRFNRIFGFFKTGDDEYDVHYRIERLKCR